ncbi:MAG: hypothetical protein HYV60_25305 [Planctomycetia bacterium]|nr:hypothetical protein [Planctomycetia bacterium]
MPGSSILAAELAEFQRSLEPAGDLDKVNWLAIDDILVDQKRSIVRNVLAGGRDHPKNVYIARIAPKLAKIQESMPTLPELSWIGILLKDEDGASWTSKFAKDGADQSGDLLMRHWTGTGATSLFVSVGALSQGKVNLVASQASNMVEGRPVWLVRRDKDK